MFYRIIWEFSQHGRRGCSQPQNLCSILTPNVPFHGGSVKTEMEGDIEQGITVGWGETGELRRDKGKSEGALMVIPVIPVPVIPVWYRPIFAHFVSLCHRETAGQSGTDKDVKVCQQQLRDGG